MAEPKDFLRFTVPQRLEHWAYAISFATLAITGLPQKFAGDGWAESMITLMGGIELVRTIHHTAAIVMVLAAIYHVIVLAYKVFVLRVRWTMFPRLDDAIDAIDNVRYNLGLTKEHPKFDRYNFAEKAEYWAGAWGTIIMALTGFIMWNPITAAQFLPGDLIPASKAAHGAEAILAVGAILIWHFYNVHFKTLNKAVFTGKLSAHQMEEEHGLELERIRSGNVDPRPAPDIIKDRERAFIPIATVAAVVMLVILFFATAYESTAISTLPRRQSIQIYAPVTPTPAGTPAGTSVSAVKPLPADHAGRTVCLSCHQNLPDPKLPADHAGRSDATCTSCHKVGGTAPTTNGTPAPTSAPGSSGGTGTAKPLPADHAGRTTCMACHQNLPDPKLPVDHQGRTDQTCVTCHSAGSSTAPVGSTSATGSGSTGGISPIPADHAGRTVCMGCHQNLPQPKLPADHAGRTDATCTSCHKPQ